MRQRSALTPSRMMVAAWAALVSASSRKRRSSSATRLRNWSSDSCETSRPSKANRSRACARPAASIASDSRSPLWILRVLARIEVPIWPGMTTEHLMCGALIRRSVISASVNPLTANFRSRIGGMRDAWSDRGPKAVDDAGVDDVALLGVLQHRQQRAGAVIDATPADVERALPFVAAVGNHAAAAADTGVVEQQVDLVGLVTVGNLVAKALDLRPVGDIDDVRRDPQPLRQSRRLAQSLRFRQAGRRDVAHRDIAGFRHQLADQLAAHSAAAAGDYCGPPREFGHVYLPKLFRGRSRYGPSPTSPPVVKRSVGAMSGRQPPASLARELLEEIDIIGALGRPADQFIDIMGVWPDQNAPLVGLDSVEDDRRRFGGAGRRLLAEAALALGDPLPDVVV